MSEEEQIEALAKLLRNLPVNRVDLSYEGDGKIVADFIINAGYRLPETEKKELLDAIKAVDKHIDNLIGHSITKRKEPTFTIDDRGQASPIKCTHPIDSVRKQPPPAVKGIVWPSRKDAIANGDGKGNVDEWSMGWNACHDAHKKAREDYERGMGCD